MPRLEDVLDALPNPVFVLDNQSIVTAWNAAAARLHGIPSSQAVGSRFADLDVRRRVPRLHDAVDAVRAEGGRIDLDPVELTLSTGEPVSVACTVSALSGGAIAVLVEDRTEMARTRAEVHVLNEELTEAAAEREQIREELQTANEELRLTNEELRGKLQALEASEAAGRHKDEFLAMLAHELRNPLAPILTAMQVVRLRGGPEVQRAREIVERQVRKQARLVDDLLDLSRISRGTVSLRRERVDLREVVRHAVDEIQPLLEERRRILGIALPDEPVTVDGDPARLEQVVANLMHNAVKYTNVGGRIDVSLERRDGEAVLGVKDDGVGIPSEMLEDVFDLFRQGEAALARTEGGLGIGLTVVRSLVGLHGGSVRARSEGRGKGAELIVRLPLVPSEAAAAVAGAATAPARETPGQRARSFLIVEDNDDAREMLATALSLDGHHVETAPDGPTGVRVALADHPDVALIDIGLPEMDGYEVARRIREILHERIALIAVTGYGQIDDRARAQRAGFDAHLVKPVDPADVERIVRQLDARG